MDEVSSQDGHGKWVRAELIKLLGGDRDVRQLVLDIVAAPAAWPAPVVEPTQEPEPEPVAVLPQTPCESPHDPLREQLSAQLTLLATLSADQSLSGAWLVQSESEGLQLTRLLATAAQWERLLELWDILAARCKAASRPATSAELQILEGGLDIHNLIWRDRRAQLCFVEVGAEYDYRLHQRSSLRGEVVTAQWLPGLANAGGERQRLPLAATQ
tara:strand:- start:93 stop:734 length:642 start_codon:yes stop_codon:yes gene_type:complete